LWFDLQASQASVIERLLRRTLASRSAGVGCLARGLARADNVETILHRRNASHIDGNVSRASPICDLLRFVELIDELVDLADADLARIIFVEYFEH
jgi:hypothetical protein